MSQYFPGNHLGWIILLVEENYIHTLGQYYILRKWQLIIITIIFFFFTEKAIGAKGIRLKLNGSEYES